MYSCAQPVFAEKAVSVVRRPQLPAICSSVSKPVLSRSSLVPVAFGVVLGVAAAAAISVARSK